MYKHIIVIVLSVFCVLCLIGCGKDDKVKTDEVLTDIDNIEYWLPDLEGVISTEYVIKELGTINTRSVGPTDYEVFATIKLDDDVAQLYQDNYDWELADITFGNQTQQWYQSNKFTKEIIPVYYTGSIYKLGNELYLELYIS